MIDAAESAVHVLGMQFSHYIQNVHRIILKILPCPMIHKPNELTSANIPKLCCASIYFHLPHNLHMNILRLTLWWFCGLKSKTMPAKMIKTGKYEMACSTHWSESITEVLAIAADYLNIDVSCEQMSHNEHVHTCPHALRNFASFASKMDEVHWGMQARVVLW